MSAVRNCVAAALAALAGVAPALSCAPAARLSPAEEREQRQRFWQSRFRPVTYRVAEPDAGTVNERITVRDDGVLEMSGRLFGTALAQLPPEEVARIAEAFAGWQQLGSQYAAPGEGETGESETGESETLEELTYGGKTVRVRGNPPHLPPIYTRARAALVDAATKLR